MTAPKKPDFIAYTVTGEGPTSFWTRIGIAWQLDRSQGVNIELAALPANGRIVLSKPRESHEEAGLVSPTLLHS